LMDGWGQPSVTILPMGVCCPIFAHKPLYKSPSQDSVVSSLPEKFHFRALPEPCMILSSRAPNVRPSNDIVPNRRRAWVWYGEFVAGAVNLTVMAAAKPDGELVANLTPKTRGCAKRR
jgi:hypothetical protein